VRWKALKWLEYLFRGWSKCRPTTLAGPSSIKPGSKGILIFDWTSCRSNRPQFAPAPAFNEPEPLSGPAGVSIFTALESQLGLRLKPTKGPVGVMIIDRVERPSEN
jgi:hypothetical protein